MSPREKEDVVSFRTISQWVRAALVCQVDLPSLLHQEGVVDQLDDPQSAVIARDKLHRIMQSCIDQAWRQPSARYFPVALAEASRFDYTSHVQTFLSTAPTLRVAADLLDLLPALFDPAMSLTLTEFGSQARLVHRLDYPGETIERSKPFVEHMCLVLGQLFLLLLGDDKASVRVTFRHQRHAGSDAWEAALQLPVTYGQELDACWLDRSLLDRPLRGALPSLHLASKKQLETELGGGVYPGSNVALTGVAGKLVSFFCQQPDRLGLSQSAVAEAMALHARTLQRRLKGEQTSYQAVIDRVRYQLAAKWLLETDDTVDDISRRLCYGDRTSFTQAFQRWAGVSPAQYRKQG